jgi:hypothetical protein
MYTVLLTTPIICAESYEMLRKRAQEKMTIKCPDVRLLDQRLEHVPPEYGIGVTVTLSRVCCVNKVVGRGSIHKLDYAEE